MPVLGFQECSQFFRNKVVCSITKGSVEKIHTCKGGICRKKFRLPIFVSYSQRGHGKRNKLAIFGLGHAASTNHNMEKRRKWPSEEPANIILGRERESGGSGSVLSPSLCSQSKQIYSLFAFHLPPHWGSPIQRLDTAHEYRSMHNQQNYWSTAIIWLVC